MKKIFALVITLVLISCTAFGVIGAAVNAEKDKVGITENVLYGDKTVAKGLTVVNKNQYNYRLYWESEYNIADKPIINTEYSFYATQKRESSQHIYEGIFINDGIEWGFDDSIPASKQTGIQKAYKELFDSADYGEEKSRMVYLKDYYDYYPISLGFDLPNTYWVDYGYEEEGEPYDTKFVGDKFREYFKIPVLESDKAEISVTKGEDGGHYGTGTDATNMINLHTTSVVLKNRNRCFFTINNCKDPDTKEYVDTSLIPGGYGIYSFYYYGGDSSSGTGIMADTLKTVFSLNTETNVRHLALSADNTQLLLFTYEDTSSYLTIIDIETMKTVQKILIDDSFLYSVYQYEDFIVAESDGKYSVISCENNTYTTMYTVATANFTDEKFQDLWNVDCMDFKDGKLAVVGNTFNENVGYESCDFFVAVYDKSGLIYCAEYDNGLDINWLDSQYEANCHPNDVLPNTIKWN